MKLSSRRFRTPTDMCLLYVYSALLESPHYAKSKLNNGTAAVEHSILTITEKCGYGPFFTFIISINPLTARVVGAPRG